MNWRASDKSWPLTIILISAYAHECALQVSWSMCSSISIMVIRVVEFSREGCKIRLIFFNEKNEKDSDDFWRRKVTLKMKFGHLLSTSPLHHFVKLNDFLLICWFLGKGQLISKWFFGASIFSKKQTNKFDFTTMISQVDLFSFGFWKKLKTPLRHFFQK